MGSARTRWQDFSVPDWEVKGREMEGKRKGRAVYTRLPA